MTWDPQTIFECGLCVRSCSKPEIEKNFRMASRSGYPSRLPVRQLVELYAFPFHLEII